MKKILFIDDESERLNELKNLIKKITGSNELSVDFDYSLLPYFKPIDSGKDVIIKKDISIYRFIFIHHSIDDSKIPENMITMLRKKIGEDIIFTFSGGSVTDIERGKFNRKELYDNFPRFFKFSIEHKRWFFPALYKNNYEKVYFSNLVEDIRKVNITQLDNNTSYLKIIDRLKLEKDYYKKFNNLHLLIDNLLDEIEEL